MTTHLYRNIATHTWTACADSRSSEVFIHHSGTSCWVVLWIYMWGALQLVPKCFAYNSSEAPLRPCRMTSVVGFGACPRVRRMPVRCWSETVPPRVFPRRPCTCIWVSLGLAEWIPRAGNWWVCLEIEREKEGRLLETTSVQNLASSIITCIPLNVLHSYCRYVQQIVV